MANAQFWRAGDGEVRWDLITKLHTIQQELGLHLGNRLTQRHLNFHASKMKVNLAVQVLSRSVAVSLEYLEHQGMMQNTAPTVQFLKVRL